MSKKREIWGSKLGIIMAVAGSAIGLGNFLRFPGQVASYGGGAYLIPYFIALLLFGIPLVWIEWTAGRYGGGFGHSTAPGIFHTLWQKNRFIKYFGLIGIFGPLVIFIYYLYIESWTLGYSFYALSGKLKTLSDQSQMQAFLHGYQGLEKNSFFSNLIPAYSFFLITFITNIIILYHGIKNGIEKFCKIAMPILFCFAFILLLRVMTLGTPDPSQPGQNVINGLGFIWNPDFSVLKDSKVWLAATGQVFFTLSVGIGMILTYASYLTKADDVALSGLSAVSLNEVAEVIFGGSIVIVAAFVFFGPIQTKEIAQSGIFNLGFITMPLVINKMPMPAVFGGIWFLLLFLAGITSSISMALPAIAFLEDEFNISRKKAVTIFSLVAFFIMQIPIFFLKHGVVDEFDFWAGTVCIVAFGLIETILFVWVFGIEKAWTEIHHGSDIVIPKIYKFIMRYITPLFLGIIFITWVVQKAKDVIFMQAVAPVDKPYILLVRIVLILLMVTIGIGIKLSWRKKGRK